MDLKLNGLVEPMSLVTYNRIPTIVEISNGLNSGGEKSYINIYCKPNTNTDSLQIGDVTINFTSELNSAKNSTAYVTSLNGLPFLRAMAYYLVKALKNTSLVNKFDISMDNSSTSKNGSTTWGVKLVAKRYGDKIENVNGSPFIVEVSNIGYSNDELVGSKVLLDVYIEQDVNKQTEILANSKSLPYIETLEKNYFENGIKFDISNILGNYTDNGKLIQYNIKASYLKEGKIYDIGDIVHNYAANGYMVNNGDLYKKVVNGVNFAANVSKGKDKGTYNNTILYYVDGEKMTIPLLLGQWSTFDYTLNYYNSAKELISTETKSFTPSKKTQLECIEIIPDNNKAYYLDVVLPRVGTVRYTNIKPLKYGDSSDYESVYWYNSYGGISFFPFTASRKEERSVTRETYKKGSFDIYDTDVYSFDKIYSNSNSYKITLKSHYIEKDGIYSLYDLMNSMEAWIYIDGKKYEIIIDKLSIDETESNDIYQITLTYTYSSNDIL